jgi:hypothetical protein
VHSRGEPPAGRNHEVVDGAGPAPKVVNGRGATFLTDGQFVEANAGWWRSDSGTLTGAGILPVSIASFFAGVLRIHRVAKSQQTGPREVRHYYEAAALGRVGILGDRGTYLVTSKEPGVAGLARKLLGSRVRTISGGPIAYLTPDADTR